MRKPQTILLLACLLIATLSASGQIVERQKFALPEFDTIKEIARYAERAEYTAARSDHQFRLERVLYRSGDAVVSAYLYAPTKPVGKLPAVVFCRGSYVVNDQAPVLLTMMRRLANRGFVVLAPMLRGSDGVAGHDEMGGADLEDLRAAVEIARTLPGVDARNIFLYGESRGAMMTYFALRDGWPVQAAAVFGGLTDVREYLDRIDPQGKFAKTVWPGFDAHKEEILRSRSAIDWPEKIRTPVLIMHGGADEGVSPLHSLRLAEALTKLKTDYQLVIFAGDNHILSRNRNFRDEMATEWFRQHQVK